jgi:hypothetical protein
VRGITGGRGILGGAILVAVGLGVLLQVMRVSDAGAYLFLFLGLAFAGAYVAGTRPYVYLVPAATMTGFGLGLIIPTAFGLQSRASGIFVASLAIAYLVIYLIAPSRKIPLALAVIIGLVALADTFASVPIGEDFKPYLAPVVIILTGMYLLLETRTH